MRGSNKKGSQKSKVFYTCFLSFFVFCNFQTILSFGQYKVIIDIQYENSLPGDTMYLVFRPIPFPESPKFEEHFRGIVEDDGIVHFNIDQRYSHGYLSITKERLEHRTDYLVLVSNVFWECNDEISILINKPNDVQKREYFFDTTFAGKSAEKYETMYKIKRAYKNIQIARREENKINGYRNKDRYGIEKPNDLKSITLLKDILNDSRLNVSKFCYDVLLTDIEFSDYYVVSGMLKSLAYNSDIEQYDKDSIVSVLLERFLPIPDFDIPDSSLGASGNLISFYTNFFHFVEKLSGNYDEYHVIDHILNHSFGKVQQAILTTYLNVAGYSSKNSELYDYVASHVTDDYYSTVYLHIMSKSDLNVYNYSFINSSGMEVTLEQFRGKIILIDIWNTGCSPCIVYRNNVLRKVEADFGDYSNFQIVTINIDKNVNSWKKSLLLDTYADPNGENFFTFGEELIHPFIRDIGAKTVPTAILVGKDGDIIDNSSHRLKDYNILSKILANYLK